MVGFEMLGGDGYIGRCWFCEVMDILAGVHCTWENGDPRLQGSQSWRSSGEIEYVTF